MSSIKWCPIETLADAGAYLGRICYALDELASLDEDALKASQRYHAWDARNLMDLEPYISYIDDPNRQKLLSSIIHSFRRTILDEKEGENFRKGINHGDYNDANIIVRDDDGTGIKVSGVIDFGDSVYR